MRRLLLSIICIPLLAAADDGRRIIDTWMVRAPVGLGLGPGMFMTKAFTVERPWALRWNARSRFQVDLLDGNGDLVEQLVLQNEGGLGSSTETRVGTFALRFQYKAPWAAEVSVAAEPPVTSP